MADDKGTTLKDVSTEIELEEEVKGKQASDVRGAEMERLAAQREDIMVEDAEKAGGGQKLRENIEGAREKKPEEEPPEKPEEKPPEKPPEKPEEEKPSEEPEKPSEIEEEQIEIKVYGKTKLYPKSQVEAHGGKVAFQKELAADARQEQVAREADERQRELDERERFLTEREQQLGQPPEAPATADQPDIAALKKTMDDLEDQYLEELNYGDAEKAKELRAKFREARDALDEARERRMGSATSFDVARNAAMDVQIEGITVDINQKFALPPEEGGFADLMEDPDSVGLAWLRVEQLKRQGHDPFKWETYQAAGEWARAVIALEAKPEKKETPKELNPEKGEEILQEKLEKKKTIDVVPTASQRETTPEKETPSEEKGRQDGIAYLKKKREGG